MPTDGDVMDVLAGQLADVEAGWSVGTFGAIAEFTRDLGEPADLHRDETAISVVTDKGGLRILSRPKPRLIASESPASESWSHRIALCLPHGSCAMHGRTTLTEIGADDEALRSQDQNNVLFDLGLGTLQIDACIRVGDPDEVAALRARAGRSVFAPGNDAMRIILAANPHRVFISRVGRAEVFQPIPPPDGGSPDGPHTHVLPKLLAHGRTHAATEPVPDGLVPCAHLYPAHPLRDQFGRIHEFRPQHQAAFQELLEQYGEADSVELKRDVVQAVMAGRGPDALAVRNDRVGRATVRVTLRQLVSTGTLSSTLVEWLAAYDRINLSEPENPMEALH